MKKSDDLYIYFKQSRREKISEIILGFSPSNFLSISQICRL